MLQKEFEDRIGREVSENEYVMADAAYMACGDDIDKNRFCRLYKSEAGLHELVNILSDRVRELRNTLDACRRDARETGAKLMAANEDIRRGNTCTRVIDNLACSLMGEREYFLQKLSSDELTITVEDREMLRAIIGRL